MRRGFALLSVLWVVTAMSVVITVATMAANRGARISGNRVVLERAAWAAEACLDILRARYAADSTTTFVDSVDLGRGTWCRAVMEDPATRLDLNDVTPPALARLVGNDSVRDAILDWRDEDDVARPAGAETDWYRDHGRRPPRNGPFQDVGELAYVRGVTPELLPGLERVLTVGTATTVSVNGAGADVLRTLPGMTDEAVDVVLRLRSTGQRLTSTVSLAALLSPPARAELMASYQEIETVARYDPEFFVATIEAGVRGTPLVERQRVGLAVAAKRLALLWREVS